MLTTRHLFAYLILLFVSCFSTSAKDSGSGSADPGLHHPALVSRFYSMSGQQLFWFSPALPFSEIKTQFIRLIDSAVYDGLNKDKYHYAELANHVLPADSTELLRLDRLFTDAAISYCKDLYQGADIASRLNNDEVSAKYAKRDDEYVLNTLLGVRSAADLASLRPLLIPKEKEYSILRSELEKQVNTGDHLKIAQVKAAVNFYRWMHHFNSEKFIVVNIPSATLRYYQQDSMRLQMKVVVGKPATRSPRFSSWCYEVVLYPYWNVPRSIAVNELFPRFKKNPASMDAMNMQLINKSGKVVDHTAVNWGNYSAGNFPYGFRQCTGCDNSLGVIKFNLTDPFNVYLHDTNFKLAFLKDRRFLSHGCIRVEKPIDLGNYLLDNRLDSAFLKACLKGQKPVINTLEKRVPVFVVYMTAEVNADTVMYHKDIYRLFK